MRLSRRARRHRRGAASSQHVVFLLHGIRTHAEWERKAKETLENGAVLEAVPLSYGYLNGWKFVIPLSYFRNRKIQGILRKIRVTRGAREYRNADFSIVAHSFGTYIASEILRAEKMPFRRAILVGSIVSSEFPWGETRGRVEKGVLSEVGQRDIWPVLAQGLRLGYGASGTFGTPGSHVSERFHPSGHSELLTSVAVLTSWREFLANGTLPADGVVPAPVPYWMTLLSGIPLLWVVALLLVLLLALGLRFV